MMRNITVGIDIGTYQVKVVVSELVKIEGKPITRIIGTGLAESKGLRHGYIVNGPEVTEAIKSATAMAEKTSGVKIRRAFLGVGGVGLSAFTSTASSMVSRADEEISELEIANIAEECEKEIPKTLLQNRRILHSIQLSYKI